MSDLEKTLKLLKEKYGEDAVTVASKLPPMRKIPLYEPAFDYATDGGVPINRTLELYGPFSSLKSWFTLKIIGAFQKYDWANNVPYAVTSVELAKARKSASDIPVISKINVKRGYKPLNPPKVKLCALLDVEGTFDPAFAAKRGVNLDLLIHIRPSSLNQGVDILETFMRSEEVGLAVIDSMIASGSDGEIDKSMEDEQMAINARFWSKAARKFKSAMNENKDVTLVAVNGYYDKVGLVFGNPEKVKNGNQWALLKDISLRLFPRKETTEKDSNGNEVVTGRFVQIANKKNKCGKPFLESELFYSFVDDEINQTCESDKLQQLVDLGFLFGLISKRGSWVDYGKLSVQGMDNFKLALRKKGFEDELQEEIYKNINRS